MSLLAEQRPRLSGQAVRTHEFHVASGQSIEWRLGPTLERYRLAVRWPGASGGQ